MMKNLLHFTLFFVCVASYAQKTDIVHIPDPVFKEILLRNKDINTNKDTEIQVSEAGSYKGEMAVWGPMITNLTGLEAFTALTGLQIGRTLITSVNISRNTALTKLLCSNNNKLTSLDVSNNSELIELVCNHNQLTSLDVSKNTKLTRLRCDRNQLTRLMTNNNKALKKLYCDENQLLSLDVSDNNLLSDLSCYSNKLVTLNLKNGQNDKITKFNAGLNPLLRCIQVDNTTTFKNRWKLFVENPEIISEDCISKVFATKLIVRGESGVDKITSVFGTLKMKTTITPTDAHKSKVSWSVDNNNLAYIDQNGLLTGLSDGIVKVTASITSNGVQITGFTYITVDTKHNLKIPDKQFKAYLVGNSAINTNGDTEIQISEATSFTGGIVVENINITDLTGVEAFVAVTSLDCSGNQLTSLNVSKNVALTSLDCGGNQLTSLDLHQNTVLTKIYCQNNSLSALDLKNGNNSKLTDFDAIRNPNLNCIQVDDVSNFKRLWGQKVNHPIAISERCTQQVAEITVQGKDGVNKITSVPGILQMVAIIKPDNVFSKLIKWEVNDDKIATISQNGVLTSVKEGIVKVKATALDGSNKVGEASITITGENIFIPDANFKKYLVENLAINTNKDNEILISEAANFAGTIDVGNKNIIDLTGIEKFTKLTKLACGKNQLTSLDVTKNTALTELECNANLLTSLDVSRNIFLTKLNCSSNQLPLLNINNNTALTELFCGYNKLTSLDISINHELTKLNCEKNELTSMDISKNTLLSELHCGKNQLKLLDIRRHTNLTQLDCSSNQLSFLNVMSNVALARLNCGGNKLFQLEMSNNPKLTELNCEKNQLLSIDVSKNSALTKLNCGYNQFTFLDVENNPLLTELNCSYNQLTFTNISKNLALTALDCSSNKIKALDISKNVTLATLSCMKNQLTNLDVSSNVAITELVCSDNKLTTLNLKNGQNDKLKFFDAVDNPNLKCIQVDNANNFKTNWEFSIDDLGAVSEKICVVPVAEITVRGKGAVDKITSVFGTLQIEAIVKPKNASFRLVNWSVDDKTVAVIDSNGLLTALKTGSVTITATAKDNPKVTGKTVITVSAFSVYIPDANFKKYLVENPAINTNKDSEILISEAASFTGKIDVGNKNITDLTGIQTFLKLSQLDVSRNKLSSLDVSKNTVLTHLICKENQLTSLDISHNSELVNLNVESNRLTYLDISRNKKIQDLDCSSNKLISIKFNKNSELQQLICARNDLLFLELSSTDRLTYLDCTRNKINFLDISTIRYTGTWGSTSTLNSLFCTDNRLQIIKAKNPGENFPGTFYAKGNPELNCIEVNNPDKVKKNLKTAHGGEIHVDNLSAFSRNCVPLVSEIIVEGTGGISIIGTIPNGTLQMKAIVKPIYAVNRAVVWSVDNPKIATIDDNGLLTAVKEGKVKVIATSTDGSKITGETIITISRLNVYIPDVNFKKYLIKNTAINTNKDSEIQITEASAFVGDISVKNKNISDFKGIEAFSLLTGLDCSENQLTSLDVSTNIAINRLNCSGNQLASLNASKNVKLTKFDCSKNQLTTLNLRNGKNHSLIEFDASDNPNLNCIQVDDAPQFKTRWGTKVNNLQAIRENCSILVEEIKVKGEDGINKITSIPGTLQLEIEVKPSNASKSVSWHVDDEQVATIDRTGKLTAHKVGKVTVTATANDGSGVTGGIVISTTQWVKSITIWTEGNKSRISLGEKLQLMPTILPADATEDKLEWSVDFKALASINSKGLLTALNDGKVTAFATATDGSGVNEKFEVTISNVTGLSNKTLGDSNITIYPNPAGNTLKIDHKGLAHQIVIADMTGKIIKTVASENKKMSVIDVSRMESKMYILQIYTKDEVHYRKFIKL